LVSVPEKTSADGRGFLSNAGLHRSLVVVLFYPLATSFFDFRRLKEMRKDGGAGPPDAAIRNRETAPGRCGRLELIKSRRPVRPAVFNLN